MRARAELLEGTHTGRRFDGRTYDPTVDGGRLVSQLQHTFNVQRDAAWRTVPEIQDLGVVGTHTGIQSRCRDFRKDKFGAFPMYSRRRGNARRGVWEFRVITCIEQGEY